MQTEEPVAIQEDKLLEDLLLQTESLEINDEFIHRTIQQYARLAKLTPPLERQGDEGRVRWEPRYPYISYGGSFEGDEDQIALRHHEGWRMKTILAESGTRNHYGYLASIAQGSRSPRRQLLDPDEPEFPADTVVETTRTSLYGFTQQFQLLEVVTLNEIKLKQAGTIHEETYNSDKIKFFENGEELIDLTNNEKKELIIQIIKSQQNLIEQVPSENIGINFDSLDEEDY